MEFIETRTINDKLKVVICEDKAKCLVHLNFQNKSRLYPDIKIKNDHDLINNKIAEFVGIITDGELFHVIELVGVKDQYNCYFLDGYLAIDLLFKDGFKVCISGQSIYSCSIKLMKNEKAGPSITGSFSFNDIDYLVNNFNMFIDYKLVDEFKFAIGALQPTSNMDEIVSLLNNMIN